jgi:hypothetical protein
MHGDVNGVITLDQGSSNQAEPECIWSILFRGLAPAPSVREVYMSKASETHGSAKGGSFAGMQWGNSTDSPASDSSMEVANLEEDDGDDSNGD